MNDAEWGAAVATAVEENRHRPGALLPILHAIQDELGHVPPDVVPSSPTALNLSRAEVHGVVSFYHHFRSEPPGRHVVQICRAEACQSMGADALVELRRRSGSASISTRPRADGAFTLEPVYCLGNCACSPAMMVDGRALRRVSRRSASTRMVARLRGARP